MKNNLAASRASVPLAICAALGFSLAGPAAEAATVMTLDFDGGFNMYFNDNGSPSSILPGGAAQGAVGTMEMTIPTAAPNGPYPGTVDMQSVIPFFGSDWTATGTFTAYQSLDSNFPAYCAGYDFCADASILFSWGGNLIPVDASFGLNASSTFDPLDPVNSLLTTGTGDIAPYFSVESVDADGDGIPGTALTDPPFVGISPYFFGNAVMTEACITDDLNILPDVCTPLDPGAVLPDPIANALPIVATVPVPAAAWLFTSGILGLVTVARRRKRA